MSRIRVLPEVLANKIAAGEIVERPASVVKELLENAIDAGARSLEISVNLGGKKLIRVRDDGEGMAQDDAILAFEHHATSKIGSVEDLTAIATLGFRGEALPSIASVSRVVLRTRPHRNVPDAGTEVEIEGGTLRSVKPVAWDSGTEIVVRDLFFNVPARRKFLRSNDTELGHVTRLVTQYAIAHPEMRFRLDSENRNLLDVAPAGGTGDRLYQLFGEGFLENLVELEGDGGDVRIRGLCSQPHEQRTNAYSQFFFVNRRMVRDKVITSAVRQAYRHTMPASAYPVVVLFVEIPFDQVDVNAHPAKIEVRFRQQSVVHDLIRDTIGKALVGTPSVPSYEHWSEATPGMRSAGEPGMAPDTPRLPQGPFVHARPTPGAPALQHAFQYPCRETPAPSAAPEDHQGLRMRPELLLGAPLATTRPFQVDEVRILGQIHDSYIIATDKHGLLIIDQHVAHERVLYEKFADAMHRERVETQGLLVPLTVELAPFQLALFRRVLPELQRNGFQAEMFGGSAVVIRSVPAVAGDQDCRTLLGEILEGIDSEERTVDVARIRDRIAVGMACRAAIKVHTPLTADKMRWLLDELGRTRIPTNCPHGRPIILRFSLYEIERNFGRI